MAQRRGDFLYEQLRVDGVMSAERLPNVQPKMDPMIERILNLTLEIISLLTGESFPLMKSGDHMTITVPLFHSVKPERHNMKKILEVIQKMMELLTEEGGLDGDGVESQKSLLSWDPPEEAKTDEQSPYCKEESLEDRNPPNDVLHPPTDITQLGSGGIKEEPEGGSVISPIMECPLLSDGSPLHTLSSWESPEEAIPNEQSPYCKEESLENRIPTTDILHPPIDLMQQESSGIKEEPEGESVISPIMERSLLSNGSPLHTLSSWDPPEEAKPDEQSPYCNKESMEDGSSPNDVLHPPTDLTQHRSGGIKEEPEDESALSPIIERPLLSADGSHPHTDVAMAGDLLHLDLVAHHTPTQVKEELFVSDEGLDVPTSHLPALVPEAPLEGEFMEGESMCFKQNVVDTQGVEARNKPRPILPKPHHHVANGKQFSCAECGRSCRSNYDLIQHCRVHSGEKPFQCSECGKCFSNQSSLALHYRIHAGQKPHSCLECGKCFISKSELTKHSRSHTGLKPYACPECGKFFTCSSNLFRHKKIHTGEKHFICSECGKGFLTRSQMTIHLRVHTGEKPYPCSECSKCFVSSSDLAKHHRSHTGLKPHICPQCGKSYVSRSVLTRHQKIHAAAKSEKRFFCADCGLGFVRTGTFLAHVESHHRASSQTPKLVCELHPNLLLKSHS